MSTHKYLVPPYKIKSPGWPGARYCFTPAAVWYKCNKLHEVTSNKTTFFNHKTIMNIWVNKDVTCNNKYAFIIQYIFIILFHEIILAGFYSCWKIVHWRFVFMLLCITVFFSYRESMKNIEKCWLKRKYIKNCKFKMLITSQLATDYQILM